MVMIGVEVHAAVIIERRRPFALLRLAGTHLRELHRTVLAEAAVPLLVVALATAGLGMASNSSPEPAAHHRPRPVRPRSRDPRSRAEGSR